MIYKVFLDTNILIDFFVQSREKHSIAQKIFTVIESGKIKGFVSETVVNTAAYLLQKNYPANKLKNIFSEMLNLVTILNSNNKSFKDAYKNNINDLEDAVLYQIALNNKMDYFISNDKTHFKNINIDILPVIASEKFLKILED
ncbi:MAG: type II toxin-antitoxin system VapC family toxin [Chitinophagaceae bacterium]|nr:type II toxin-antitoxin system VapC family toxin [Chitinophagaceae bacterium]